MGQDVGFSGKWSFVIAILAGFCFGSIVIGVAIGLFWLINHVVIA